ncbi:MAG: hypothetical protein FJ144_18965 [Deltaproteobacteria bacterium]|nr:hypothetical protein [Deltaproteobacteria bacterium]
MKADRIAALLGAAAVALAAGCTTIDTVRPTTTMNARLLGSSGAAATPIEMEYQSQTFGTGGTITATVPSGESFNGHYAVITRTSGTDTLGTSWGGWGSWEPYWKDWGPHGSPWVQGDDFATFVQNYSGKAIATLFGDRGDTMRCRFQLSDPEEGMEGGGVGQCQTSSGENLEAQF